MAEVENEEGRVAVMGEGSIHLVDMDVDIYILNKEKKDFFSACLDTGESMSLLGREQAEAYYKVMGIPLTIE